MRLIHGNCADWLRETTSQSVKCVFLDPPDNVKLNYGPDFEDYRVDYQDWLMNLIQESMRVSDIVWVCYSVLHDLWLKARLFEYVVVSQPSIWEVRSFIWRYSFSQYRDSDCADGYRCLLRLRRRTATLYADTIRVPSKRSFIGDKRAANDGYRVPDSCWEFPRIVGNSRERRAWHPTQLPEELYIRCMKLSCVASDTFVDLFAGTGTCFRAAKRIGFDNVIGIELSASYCEQIRFENHK